LLGFVSVAMTWEWNLAGIKEWFALPVAASDVPNRETMIFLQMTKPIYSFRVQLPLWLGGCFKFAQLPFTPLPDFICCHDVYKCMKVADAAAVAAARQQPRWG
jgi:hypothetical protein